MSLLLLFLDLSHDALYMTFGSEANVTIKDSIFQPSTPIRHATELMAINARVSRRPEAFAMAFTDGGPNHNISFF